MTFELVNLALSILSAVGIGYLLLSAEYAVGYHRFFKFVLTGFLLYSTTGIVALVYASAALHLVHAASALFVAAGCYSLLSHRLSPNDDFSALDH